MVRGRLLTMTMLATAVLLVAGCGGDDNFRAFTKPGEPVGEPVLPDLMPSPPDSLGTKRIDGKWHISFSTIIVNVGKGDLLLRATRVAGSQWSAEQLIPYSRGGADAQPISASLVWGGDGHDHWHVLRVASVWLTSRDEGGKPVEGDKSMIDTKIGFCFYDFGRELDRGPQKAVYSSKTCGTEDDTLIGMGLSPGWNDTYPRNLPGQSIDVSGLPDGRYRMWAEVDESKWFREVSRRNNITWADFELSTKDGTRYALVTGVGPEPS